MSYVLYGCWACFAIYCVTVCYAYVTEHKCLLCLQFITFGITMTCLVPVAPRNYINSYMMHALIAKSSATQGRFYVEAPGGHRPPPQSEVCPPPKMKFFCECNWTSAIKIWRLYAGFCVKNYIFQYMTNKIFSVIAPSPLETLVLPNASPHSKWRC